VGIGEPGIVAARGGNSVEARARARAAADSSTAHDALRHASVGMTPKVKVKGKGKGRSSGRSRALFGRGKGKGNGDGKGKSREAAEGHGLGAVEARANGKSNGAAVSMMGAMLSGRRGACKGITYDGWAIGDSATEIERGS
jgi:hypothetical protein